ncbi:MAG: VacB/RNase II family 3'-5' exoribonuclease, partial [Clostridia bacterium]
MNKNYKPMTKNEIYNSLSIPKGDVNFEKIINSLVRDKSIDLIDGKYYKSLPIIATFQYKTTEYGFAICKDANLEDVYIPSKYFLDVYDKDEIEIKLTNTVGNRRVGKIVKIIKRNLEYVIGKVYKVNNKCYVEPFTKNTPVIMINEVLPVDSVVKVKINNYIILSGNVVSNVGNIDENNIYVKALKEEYNLDKDFNNDVLSYVENISDKVLDEDLIGRVDKTSDTVFTIDGSDAKDLDDAIAIKYVDNVYKLSVHIADVSYYVKDNSVLDKEAISRATSIYIPNKVIPMLPKKLSNTVCSLNENEIRLTMSIDIDIDNKGNVIKSKLYKGFIKSRKKMTYEDVFKYINKSDENIIKEYSMFDNEINLMVKLQKLLNDKRNLNGCINFDIPETKVILNDKDEVIDIKPYDITIANKIIEEFMLIANTEVAKTFYNLKLPFIYRIHEKPDIEKLYDLNIVLSKYNKKINNISNICPKDLSDVLKSIDNDEEKQVISTLMLRTLKLAKYSNVCNIHFGLNFENYTHFTSPIRR